MTRLLGYCAIVGAFASGTAAVLLPGLLVTVVNLALFVACGATAIYAAEEAQKEAEQERAYQLKMKELEQKLFETQIV